jgi:catalase
LPISIKQVFVRFSTAVGSKGSFDLARDVSYHLAAALKEKLHTLLMKRLSLTQGHIIAIPQVRGFATKFYTKAGKSDCQHILLNIIRINIWPSCNIL